MMGPSEIVEIPFGWIVFAAFAAVLVVGGLMAARFDQKHRAEFHEETLRALVVLDPSLLKVFPPEIRFLESESILGEYKIQELADTKRAANKQRISTEDVEKALAALVEARKEDTTK